MEANMNVQTMKIGVVRGLERADQVNDERSMFISGFTTLEAGKAVETVEAALKGLPLFEAYGGSQAHVAAVHEENLKKLADKNLDLFLYAVKAAMDPDVYFGANDIYSRKLPEYVAEAVNEDPARQMPVFRHMTRIWPHTEYWCVVSNILSKAYAMIRFAEPDSAADMQSMLRDPYKHPVAQESNWREAMNAMMRRAKHFPQETEAQFAVLFAFLNIYGMTGAGKNGIMIPEGIYRGAIKEAFEAQGEEMQQKLCDMRDAEFYHNPRRKKMLGGLRVNQQPEEFFAGTALMKKTDAQKAKDHFIQNFKAFSNYDWDKLDDPQIAGWLGEVLSAASVDDKQTLIYKLTFSRRRLVDDEGARAVNAQVHTLLGDVLNACGSRPEEGEKGEVLAECARMFAIASGSDHKRLNVEALKGDMLALIERHVQLEIYQRRVLDGIYDQNGNDAHPYRVWPKLLTNYSLQRVIAAAVTDRIQATDLNDSGAVRKLMDLISITYAPGGNSGSIQYAIPHQDLAEAMKQVIGYRRETRRATKEYAFMRDVFGKIVDALAAVLNQDNYSRYYFDVVTALVLYYASLDPAQANRLSASKQRLDEWTKNYHFR